MKRIVALLLSLIMLLTQPFSCALAEFPLPASLKTIKAQAFAGNPMISGNVELPENTQSVGDSAFADTGVFAMHLPDATTQVGSQILKGTDATYVVVGNANAALASDAFAGVPVIVGKAGSTAQSYAASSGAQFYAENKLAWKGGFAYYVHEGEATLAFPASNTHSGTVTIPETVSGAVVCAVSPYALTNIDVDAVYLPGIAYANLPENTVNWPDAKLSAYGLEAWLDEEHYELLVGDVVHLGQGYDSVLPVTGASLTSSNPSVVSVGANGMMTALSEGVATITYTVSTATSTATATATVEVSAFEGSINPQSLTLNVGESAILTVTMPEDAIGEDYGFWSLDPQIAEVSHTGKVTALSAGSTIIRHHAQYKGRDLYLDCLVTVTDENARLTLNKESVSLYNRETVVLEPIYAEGDEPVSIEWSSVDPDYVMVSPDGRVEIISSDFSHPDSTTVICKATFADGQTAEAYCRVYAEKALVTLDGIKPYYVMEIGEKAAFQYALTFADGLTAEDFDISIFNPAEGVVTVDENGMMTAVSEGETVVVITVAKDGRRHLRGASRVLVEKAIPQITGEDWISFNHDHFFFTPPADGEPFKAGFGVQVSNPEFFDFYRPVFSETSVPEDCFVMDEDGSFEVLGEGTVELTVTMVQPDDLAEVPESFVGTARVTIAKPGFAISVADHNGENEAPLSPANPIEIGDVVTITLTGVPEDIGHNYTNWDYNGDVLREIGRTDRSLTLLAAFPGESHLYVESELDNNCWFEQSLGEKLVIQESEDEYQLCESAIVLSVGERTEIWPDFDNWDNGSLSSSNEDVAVPVEGEFPMFRAVAPGTAEMTLTCTVDEQEIQLVCYVTVVESEWKLESFNAESIMLVGESYEPEIHLPFTGRMEPRLTFSFSDDSLMEMDEEEWRLRPLAPGKVTITVTAEKDGRQESLSCDVLILEQAIRFNLGEYLLLHPGEVEILTIENNTGKAIKSVQWNSSQSKAVSLETSDSALLSAVVTASDDVSKSLYTLITCTVTFEDGTTASASAFLQVASDEEIGDWLNLWLHRNYFELSVGDYDELGYDYDSPKALTGIIYSSSDESVATISANGIIHAVGPGEADLTITLTNGIATTSRSAHVVVSGFTATLNPASLNLTVGDSAYLRPSVSFGEEGYWIDDQRTSFWSSNEDVVTVDHLGMVTAVAPGSAAITYEAYTFYGDHRMLAVCPVTVTAAEADLTLNAAEISLRPREEFQLEVTTTGELYSEITWSSSSDQIAVVNGLVKAMNWDVDDPWDAVHSVTATAIVDGVETTAVCQVTLLPPVVSIIDSPNFYELTVGAKELMRYKLSVSDESLTIVPSFVSTDSEIATIDENGVITAHKPGVCMVRLDLTDESGKLLRSGAAYVYVDTPIPTPADEDADFGFPYPLYYLNLDDELSPGGWTDFYDNSDLGVYHRLCFASDDEGVVEIYDDGNFRATGEGETTIRAWYEGYEEHQRTATVFVGDPHFTFDKPLDEHGRPVMTIGETMTITLEGFPPLGEDENGESLVEHIHLGTDNDFLQDVSREGNTLTVLALDNNDGLGANLDIKLGCDWWHNFDFEVVIEEDESEFRLEQSAVVVAEGEEFELWPLFPGREGYFTTDDENVVAPIEPVKDTFPTLRAVGKGISTVTAHAISDETNDWVEARATVAVIEGSWQLMGWGDLNDVNTMLVGNEYGETVGQNVHLECTFERWPTRHFESSDPSILRCEQENPDEEYSDWRLIPLRPGVVTLTVTAERYGEVQSLSKTIVVTAPAAYFAQQYVDVRVGGERIVPLIITSDKEVSSIEYVSEDAGLVAVEDASEDYGAPAMRAIGVKDNNSTRAFATVTFEDGSIAHAVVQLEPTSGDVELDLDADDDYFGLITTDESWANGEHYAQLNLRWGTSAALPTDPNRLGTDRAWIDWTIDGVGIDEEGFGSGIVEFVGFVEDENGEPAAWNNSPIFKGVGEGEVDVQAHMTITNAEGQFLADGEYTFHIEVHEPYVDFWFTQDRYTLNVGEGRLIDCDLHEDLSYAHQPWATVHTSDDESIVTYDTHGNIHAIAAGETDVHSTLNINGHQFTATTHVVVNGVRLELNRDAVTLEVGQTQKLRASESANGMTINERWWQSHNIDVVHVTSDGTLHAVAPGSTVVEYRVRTDNGEYWTDCVVTVTGEAPAFTLDKTAVTLWPEDTAKLHIVSDFDVPEGSFTFTSDNDMVIVDDEGNLTVQWNDGKTEHVTITCTAEADGQTHTATCLVTVMPRRARILEHQFGQGRWENMEVGGELEIWESVSIADADVQVDISLSSDDEDIIVWDDENEVFRAVSKGSAYVHYTITLLKDGEPTGEDYTLPLLILVREDVPAPETLSVDKELVVAQAYGGELWFGYTFSPLYSNRALRFYSDDIGIADVNEYDSVIYPQRPGRTTIRVECEEYPHLNTSFDVLVVDLHVAADDGRTTFAPGEAVQLVIKDQDGNVFSDEYIQSVRFFDHNPDDYSFVTEEGLWTSRWHFNEEVWLYAEVTFIDGSTYELHNDGGFRVDGSNPFFFLVLENAYHIYEYVACVGDSAPLEIHSRVDLGETTVSYSTVNRNVATVDEYGRVTCVGLGETVVNAAIEYGDATYYASFPVRVIEPQTPDFWISPHGTTLKEGEILQLYIGYTNENAYAPDHGFTSLNTDVLEPVYERDEEGNILYHEDGIPITVYGQFIAKKPGSAVITSDATFGHGDDAKTAHDEATFYVIGNDPNVYLGNENISLRPDQQLLVPVHVETEGTGRTVSSFSYAVDNAALLKAEEAELSNGDPAVKLTGLSAESDATLIVRVTFDDGSLQTVFADVNMVSNDEVWVDALAYDMHLSIDDWSGLTRDVVWQSWKHNASFYDEVGKGSDTAWIEWEIEDESIAVFDGQYVRGDGTVAPWNNGMYVKALREGETTIRTHLTLMDKDGNFLVEDWAEFPLIVSGSELDIWFEQDEFHLAVGRDEYAAWNMSVENAMDTHGVTYGSDDESIAMFDVHGHIHGLNAGETDVYVSVSVNGHEVRDYAHVVVEGVELRLLQDEITVAQGEIANIILYQDDRGVGVYNPRWTSSDPAVAVVSEHGVVRGVAPGKAVITYGIDTDHEYQEIHCLVTVTGEDTGFALNYDGVDLYPEQGVQLEIAASGAIDESTIAWTSSNEDLITVDENGYVAVVNPDNRADTYVTVTATAMMDGEQRSASCVVKVMKPNVRIKEYMFGNDIGMRVGDTSGLWEQYELINGNLRAEVTITSDDESIVYWDAERELFMARSEGETDVHYTVTVYDGDNPTGESYTRTSMFHIGEQVIPSSIRAGGDPFIVWLEDGMRYLDFYTDPAYSWTDTVWFYSRNPEILTFDNKDDAWMTLHSAGLATVEIVCPADPHLNTTTQVLVIDQDRLELLPVDGRANPYLVAPNETVELGFFMDGEPFDWYGLDVSYEPHRNYDPERLIVDGMTVRTMWNNIDWEIHHWLDVIIDGANEPATFCYTFSVNTWEPFFYATVDYEDTKTSLVGCVGDSRDITFQSNMNHEELEVTYVSGNEDVVTMDGCTYTLRGLGETVITVTAKRGDETYVSEVPVKVIEPTVGNFWIESDNGSFVAHVGEIIELHVGHDNENNLPPDHHFESADQSVLRPVCFEDEYGHLVLVDGAYVEFDGNLHEGMTRYSEHYGQFEALKTGSAVITAHGHYGHDENEVYTSASSTFYVIEHEPKIFLAQPHVDIRPDETVINPICYHDTNTGWEIESVSYAVEHPALVSVEEHILDTGASAAKLVGLASEGDTTLTATVTFTNGKQLSTTSSVHIVSNDEVWVDAWVSEPVLWYLADENGTGETIMGYNADVVWTLWNHNASHFDEEGMGSDKAHIDWWIDEIAMGEEGFGSGIVEFVGYATIEDGGHAPWNNGPVFRAVAPGVVPIRSHLTLTDKDGNFLAEDYSMGRIVVREATMDVWVDHEDVTMRVADEMYPGWHWHEEGTPTTTTIEYLSSDESVVTCSASGHIFAVAPGEATVTMRHTFDTGVSREVSMNVTVVGAEAFWADEAMYSLSLTPGETAPLTPSVNVPEEICFATDGYWENANDEVVELYEEDGQTYVRALRAGTAVVSYWQNLEYYTDGEETEWGECFVYSTITVTDEDAPFTLNHTSATLAGDGTLQLEPVYDENELGELVSLSWEVIGGDQAFVTDDGLVSVDHPRRTFYAAVVCTAEFADGAEYSATCMVTINPALVTPRDYQYGEDQWQYMEPNSVMGFWDCYEVHAQGVTVERTFEVVSQQADDDELENPTVVTVDPDTGYITSYDISGQADVEMTLRVFLNGEYAGESYVRNLHVQVNRDTFPDAIHGKYEVFVVPYQWEQHYLPLAFEPMYTGCYVECYSSDESIVSFDEGPGSTEMYFHGRTGHVYIDVVCPENEDLNTTVEVMVIDEENVHLREENHRTALLPGQTVQLMVQADGVDINDRAIERIEWRSYYGEDQFTLSDTGVLTVERGLGDPDEEFEVFADIYFRDGYDLFRSYRFKVLPVSIGQSYIALRPGQTAVIPLDINLDDSGRTVKDIHHWVDDSGLLDYGLHQDEDGGYYLELNCLDAYDDTELHVTLILDDGSEYHVSCWIDTIPDEEIWINAHGEELWLCTDNYGWDPMSQPVWARWDTNAMLAEGENPGPDTIDIEWYVYDESCARLDGWYTDENGNRAPWNNAPMLVAVDEGGMTMEARVIVRNADGEEIAHDWCSFPVVVNDLRFDAWAEQDTMTLRMGESQNINWRTDGYGPVGVTNAYVDVSDDESIAAFDMHGNIVALNPGETTVTRHYYMANLDEPLVSASVHVTVEGPKITVPETLEMTVGQQMPISEYFSQVSIDLNGLGSDGDHIEVGNGHVLSYENGVLTAHQPGKANLFWDVTISDWDDWNIRYVTEVIVTGEADFTLSQTSADLVYGESLQLTPVYDPALGELEEIHWESYWGEISVTDDGLVTAHSQNNKDESGTIHCWAIIGGNRYDATCEVMARTRKLRPMDWHFDGRRYYTMNLGDHIYADTAYELIDPDLDVAIDISIDDEDILILTDNGFFKAVGVGDTYAHYTYTVSNGERYTVSALFRVDPPLEITELTADYGTFVVNAGWYSHYFPLTTDPANVPLNNYPSEGDGPRVHLDYYSDNTDVVYFDEHGGEMFFRNSGRANVEAYNDDLGLHAEMDVLVLDEGAIYLEAEDGRTTFTTGDTVQLVFGSHNGVIWDEGDVDHYEWRNYYGEESFTVSDDGKLTIHQDWNGYGIDLWVDVCFQNNYGISRCFTFNVEVSE